MVFYIYYIFVSLYYKKLAKRIRCFFVIYLQPQRTQKALRAAQKRSKDVAYVSYVDTKHRMPLTQSFF